MSESAQLAAGVVLFVGFVVVVVLRGRQRLVVGGRRQHVSTGSLVARGDGTAAFVCDLCSAHSPASNSRPLLTDWAHRHAAHYHPNYVR